MELGEGRVELVVGDVFGVDLEVLEEGLVEEAALERVGIEVGGLDVVGQFECRVECLLGLVFVELVAAEEVLGGGALGAYAFLFFGVDVGADRVGVVGGEELAFLVVESCQLCPGSGGFLAGDLGERVEVFVDGCPDAVALFVGELDRGVVALDGLLDRVGSVVGLRADPGMTAAADEVVVEAAAPAAGSVEEEAASALGADEAAAQVVVVAPVPLAGLPPGFEELLHLVEEGVLDEGLVAARVDGACVADDADVVVVAKDRGEAVGVERLRDFAAAGAGAEAASFEEAG